MKMNWGPFMGDTSWRADTDRYTYLILKTPGNGITKLYEMPNTQPLCPINPETASQYAEFGPSQYWLTSINEAKYHARMWAMERERNADKALQGR